MKPARRQAIHRAVAPNEVENRLVAKQIVQPDRLAEVPEVRAAPQNNVLAVIDPFAGGMIDERAGAAAQARSRFDQRDGNTPVGQGGRRGQAGQSAPDDHGAPAHRSPRVMRLSASLGARRG